MSNSEPALPAYNEHGFMLPRSPHIPPIDEKIRELEKLAIDAEWEGNLTLARSYYNMAQHWREQALKGERYAPPF